MKNVVFGFYGSVLDAGAGPTRWERWRPSVALCSHQDLLVDRFELLHSPAHAKPAAVVAADIRSASPETVVNLHPFELEDPWNLEESFAALHDFAKRYTFKTQRENYLVHITTGTHVLQICWFLLTESRHFPAKLIQTSPSEGRNKSGPGSYRVFDLDLSRYDQISRRFVAEQHESVSFLKSGIETRSAAFNRLIEDIERVCLRSSEPILLTGPTGAGKTKLARQVFALKKSRNLLAGPLVEVNCATLQGDGAMSALFGHVKGAYTGATQDRIGLLRSADKGLLFLDEIGELGLDEQAMLLHAVEDKRFRPVGTDRELSVDFTLVAGTNRDLHSAVRDGRFREDLLARINLWSFALPGLADRREDIEPNLEYELVAASARLGRAISMNSEARAAFLTFARGPSALWSASFRDLNAAVLRMATLAPAGRIDVPTVRDEVRRLQSSWGMSSAPSSDLLANFLDPQTMKELDPFDRVQLNEVVRVCLATESLSEAGRTLFAASRTKKTSHNDADRLRKYLTRFGLSWDDLHPANV